MYFYQLTLLLEECGNHYVGTLVSEQLERSSRNLYMPAQCRRRIKTEKVTECVNTEKMTK